MKRTIFVLLTIFFAGIISAQKIKSGTLLSIHVINKVELKNGVTMEKFEDFYFNKYIPAFQEQFKGIKIIPLKGIRGEHAYQLGMIMVIKNEKVRNLYWNDDGSFNENGQAILDQLQSLTNTADNLGTSIDLYTDWLVEKKKPPESRNMDYPNLGAVSQIFVKNNLDHGARLIMSDKSVWEIDPKDRSKAIYEFTVNSFVYIKRSMMGGKYNYEILKSNTLIPIDSAISIGASYQGMEYTITIKE
jgi:hypothetical protein